MAENKRGKDKKPSKEDIKAGLSAAERLAQLEANQAALADNFQKALGGINQSLQVLNENQKKLAEGMKGPSDDGQREPVAESPRTQNMARPSPTDFIKDVIKALADNAEGISILVKTLKPEPPAEEVLIKRLADSFKLADSVDRVRRAIASGQGVDEAVHNLKTGA